MKTYITLLKNDLEQDLMGFSGVRVPRPTCTRKGVTDICVYQVMLKKPCNLFLVNVIDSVRNLIKYIKNYLSAHDA